MMLLLYANDRVLLANTLKDAQNFVNVIEKFFIHCKFSPTEQRLCL